MGDCFTTVKQLKTIISKSIEEGSIQGFMNSVSILENNLHRFEQLGSLRTSTQLKDKDLEFLINVNKERDEILSLLPVYEKAFYFLKDINFLNDQFKKNIMNYKTTKIGTSAVFRNNLRKAFKFADKRFGELKYLPDKTREKLLDAYDFLDKNCRNFEEICDFWNIQNLSDKLFWQKDLDAMKGFIASDDYTNITKKYFDFLKSRDAMIMSPNFNRCKDSEPFKSFYDDEEKVYKELTTKVYHEAEVKLEKAKKLAEFNKFIGAFNKNAKVDFNSYDNFESAFCTIVYKENKNDKEILDLKKNFEDEFNAKMEQEKSAKVEIQVNNTVKAITAALADKNKCRSLYTISKAVLIDGLYTIDLTENAEVAAEFAKFNTVHGEEISMNYDTQSVTEIFKNFTSLTNAAYDGIVKFQPTKFERAVKNAEFIIEKTNFQPYLTTQQVNDKNYVKITNILANKEKMFELIPFYGLYQQFKSHTGFVNNDIINKVRNNKLSDDEFKTLRMNVINAYPLYSDKFYELEFLNANDRKKVETNGPFVTEIYENIEEIDKMCRIEVTSQKISTELSNKFDKLIKSIESGQGKSILTDVDEYIELLTDMTTRTYFKEASSLDPLKKLVGTLNSFNKRIVSENLIVKHQIDAAIKAHEAQLKTAITTISKSYALTAYNMFYTTLNTIVSECPDVRNDERIINYISEFEEQSNKTLSEQREKELAKIVPLAVNEFKRNANEKMSPNEIKSFTTSVVNYSNKNICGFCTNITSCPEVKEFIDLFLANGGKLLEVDSNGKPPFEYSLWKPSKVPKCEIETETRVIPDIPNEVSISFKAPSFEAKSFAAPLIGEKAVTPKLEKAPVEEKKVNASKATEKAAKPAAAENNGQQPKEIHAVWRVVKTSQIVKNIASGNIQKFDANINEIEAQISKINVFSDEIELPQQDASDKAFIEVKEVYENRDSIREKIPVYAKALEFQREMKVITKEMREILDDLENIKPQSLKLETFKEGLTKLMQCNDDFNDLKYFDQSKLQIILETQEIAVKLYEKIDDIIEIKIKQEEAKSIYQLYINTLNQYKQAKGGKVMQKKVEKYESLKNMRKEIETKPNFDHCKDAEPLKSFLEEIDKELQQAIDENIIGEALNEISKGKFMNKYETLITQLNKNPYDDQHEAAVNRCEEDFRKERPEIFEDQEVINLLNKHKEVLERKLEERLMKEIAQEKRFTSRILDKAIPHDFTNDEIIHFKAEVEKRKHVMIREHEIDTTDDPEVQEVLDDYNIRYKISQINDMQKNYEAQHQIDNHFQCPSNVNSSISTYSTNILFKDYLTCKRYETADADEAGAKEYKKRKNQIISGFNKYIKRNKGDFNQSIKNAATSGEDYYRCKVAIDALEAYETEENVLKMKEQLAAIKKPANTPKEFESTIKVKPEKEYIKDIENALNRAIQFHSVMKKESYDEKMNAPKLLSLILGVIEACHADPEDKEYTKLLAKANDFFNSVKSEIRDGLKEVMDLLIERVNVSLDAIEFPPPQDKHKNLYKPFEVTEKNIRTSYISAILSDIAVIDMVVGDVPAYKTLLDIMKDKKVEDINKNHEKIIKEAEDIIDKNPVAAGFIIEGLWNNYSAIADVRDKCLPILKKIYQKTGRIPLNSITPVTYVFSNTITNYMPLEPMFSCDYNIDEMKDIEYYGFSSFISISDVFAYYIRNRNEIIKQYVESSTGYIHPAVCNFNKTDGGRNFTIRDIYQGVDFTDYGFISNFTEYGKEQIKRIYNKDISNIALYFRDFRSDLPYISLGKESLPIFEANTLPVIRYELEKAVDNFQKKFDTLPKRKDAFDMGYERAFLDLEFIPKETVQTTKNLIEDMSKPLKWVDILYFCDFVQEIYDMIGTWESEKYPLLCQHCKQIKKYVKEQHKLLLDQVKRFHALYSGKIITDKERPFVTLESNAKINDEYLNDARELLLKNIAANKELLEEDQEKLRQHWREMSLERQNYLKEKYIDPIKEGASVIIGGETFTCTKKREKDALFTSSSDAFRINVSTDALHACSIYITYDKSPHNIVTNIYPYNELREKFSPEHYPLFREPNCKELFIINITRENYHWIENLDSANLRNSENKDNAINEVVFECAANLINSYEKYNNDVDYLEKQIEREHIESIKDSLRSINRSINGYF